MGFPSSYSNLDGMHGSHPIFNRFWRHYDASMEWLRIHLCVVDEMNTNRDFMRSAPKRRKFPHKEAPPAQHSTGSRDSRENETNEFNPDASISDEVLDFFEVSRRHRENRDREISERKYENLENLMVTSRESAVNVGSSTNEVFERRLKRLKELYGSEWTKIHGMEMALQSGFDRFASQDQVRLWPNIPIRINLNDL